MFACLHIDPTMAMVKPVAGDERSGGRYVGSNGTHLVRMVFFV